MIFVDVKKGYSPRISGTPSNKLDILEKPPQVALLPEKIPFIKPRLKVRPGDNVKIGTLIMEDKKNPDILFLSPGSGKIADIDYGPRRVIRKIVIDLDENEENEIFPVVDEKKLENLERNGLKKIIMSGGLWPLLRELPFRNIPHPDSVPPYIIVSLDAKEPFQPLPEIYLENKVDLFEFGIKILQKLADTVFISTSFNNTSVIQMTENRLTHLCRGEYPADDPGVLSYNIKRSEAENRAWFIGGQDVLLLAGLLLSGKYPVERTVVTGGDIITDGKHVLTRIGVPLSHLAGGSVENTDPVRWVVGGLFRGYTGSSDSYLGFYETSLTIIPEGAKREFFGFARPGMKKPSRSKTFLSTLKNSDLPVDCNCHGEVRPCINCGYCEQVCPVDILPQFTYKSILIDEIEEALAHGMLDCVECGLCTYVCPSKIELSNTIKNTKRMYFLEQSE